MIFFTKNPNLKEKRGGWSKCFFFTIFLSKFKVLFGGRGGAGKWKGGLE